MSTIDKGRRRFLFDLLADAVDVVVEPIKRRLPTPLRPPGAISEPLFLAACEKCPDCVEACPEYAIFTLTDEAAVGAGTPVMAPDERACVMCDGFPCAAACTTGALVAPETTVVSFGTVSIREDVCMTFRGPECGACGGLCPTDPPALRFIGTRPAVESDLCIGCGKCVVACPTSPVAIRFHAANN